MKKNKKIYSIILFVVIGIYAIITLVNQQQTLNQYNQENKDLTAKIREQKTKNEQLAKKKEDVDSLEFIEQMAREKLDMYYPNERVYIDEGI